MYSLNELKGSTGEEMEAAYNGYAKAHELERASFSTPPIEVTVARFYLDRGFRMQNVPALLQKGLAETERLDNSRGVSDLFTLPEGAEGNLAYSRWASWPLLAEAYARTRQPARAGEVLAEMAAALKKKEPGEKSTDMQKRSYTYNAVTYWQAVAKVATAEQRKLDALMAYQTALSLRGEGPTRSS